MLSLQIGSMVLCYYIPRFALNSIARAKCISLGAGMPSALLGCFLLETAYKDSVAQMTCSLYIPVMLLVRLNVLCLVTPTKRRDLP